MTGPQAGTEEAHVKDDGKMTLFGWALTMRGWLLVGCALHVAFAMSAIMFFGSLAAVAMAAFGVSP